MTDPTNGDSVAPQDHLTPITLDHPESHHKEQPAMTDPKQPLTATLIETADSLLEATKQCMHDDMHMIALTCQDGTERDIPMCGGCKGVWETYPANYDNGWGNVAQRHLAHYWPEILTEEYKMLSEPETTEPTTTKQKENKMPTRTREVSILDDPLTYDTLTQVGLTAANTKLAFLSQNTPEAVERYGEEVRQQMWLDLAEMDDLAEVVRIVNSGKELARLAARVTGVQATAEESVITKMARKGSRTDNMGALPGWEKMTHSAQIREAGRLSNNGLFSVDQYQKLLKDGKRAAAAFVLEHAQSTLAAHTMINRHGSGGECRTLPEGTDSRTWDETTREWVDTPATAVYGPFRTIESGWTLRTKKNPEGVKAVEMRKVKKTVLKENEHAESCTKKTIVTFPDSKEVQCGTCSVWLIQAEEVEEMREYPKVDTKRGRSGNNASVWRPIVEVKIPTNGPIAEVMEGTLKMARSAESVYFRTLRDDVLIEAMHDIQYLSLFQYEESNGINYAEAFSSVHGHAPSPKERMAFMRGIRHMADAMTGSPQFLMKGANPDDPSLIGGTIRDEENRRSQSKNVEIARKRLMWAYEQKGVMKANETYSDASSGTGFIWTPEPERAEDDIRDDIAWVGHFLDEAFQKSLIGSDRDEMVATFQTIRNGMSGLHKELIGW